MRDPLGHVAFGQFTEIEAGGEMLAFAVHHHGLHVVREVREERFDAEHQGVVERVALLGPRQTQQRDGALPLGLERGRQRGQRFRGGSRHGIVTLRGGRHHTITAAVKANRTGSRAGRRFASPPAI